MEDIQILISFFQDIKIEYWNRLINSLMRWQKMPTSTPSRIIYVFSLCINKFFVFWKMKKKEPPKVSKNNNSVIFFFSEEILFRLQTWLVFNKFIHISSVDIFKGVKWAEPERTMCRGFVSSWKEIYFSQPFRWGFSAIK